MKIIFADMNRLRYLDYALRYSTFTKISYKRCYELLQVAEGSDQEQIRTAYLNLVKKFHPDSGSEHANVEKFHEIDQAFKILTAKISKVRWDKEDEVEKEEPDIKHTAPQHRHYLSYDGYGIGNPFQRERQYVKHRAIKASQNLYNHRVEKAAAEENALMKKKSARHDIKTKYGIDRLVEDLIQESISKGEFSKLSGVGKPLRERHNRNPFVDLVTHKINEVLIDNGFTPEWITLNKEIREDVSKLRASLSEERKYFKKYPLNESDALLWYECFSNYKNQVKDLNSKIDKFNLLVPILDKQIFHVNLEKEAEKVLLNGVYCDDNFVRKQCDDTTKESIDFDQTLLGSLYKMFK
ncbi:dnaJ homolog subfamily C member 28 isoform X2 [Harmonia axyridis]|uniref:dnaJ homolog subfamily C member 28 isoform X2 n=1 Tax=Harmonia axyridis TaxID=115357 RepID=UPI001E275321|nr:dnaJ homolog subfamily C member 28 isoform X2 [Harmonia axyridis]